MSELTRERGDLTEGPIGKQIISFTIPLLLGNLFQQFYNTADSIIVGKFVGAEALAAVGSSGALIHLLVSLFMGVAAGAGVVISRYYGARQREELAHTIHTNVAFGVAAGLGMSVVGILVTPTILRWMNTPESVMESSVLYFRVYFGGLLTTALYNIGSGIFRALGDSRRPLYFLILSTLVNVALDLLFVAVLGWGIGGAAAATVIAQGLSMVLVFWKLIGEGWVDLKKLRMHKKYLNQILAIGLPSGVQNAIVSLSNVVVQSNINSFGEIAMAGCAAYTKLEGFAVLPSGSFTMALSTFVSQNIGAEKEERARRGARFGLAATILVAVVCGAFIYAAAPWLISLFNSDGEIIRYGVLMAKNIVFGYALVAYSQGMSGVLRGAGISRFPMFVMVGCWCVLRVLWIQIMVPLTGDIRMVFWSYPITWACSAAILTVYFLKVDWLHKKELK